MIEAKVYDRVIAKQARNMIAGCLRSNHSHNLRWGEHWPGNPVLRTLFYPEMVNHEFREHALLLCKAFGLKAYFAAPCELDGWVFVCAGQEPFRDGRAVRQTGYWHRVLCHPMPAT